MLSRLPLPRPSSVRKVTLGVAVLALGTAAWAAPTWTPQSLALPGAPAAVISADLDGDGRRDLVLFVAYTAWDQIDIEETTKLDDIVGLVQSMTVVAALLERREIQVYRGRPDGMFETTPLVLTVDASVLSLEAGPPGLPVVALTDTGLSVLRIAAGDVPPAPAPTNPTNPTNPTGVVRAPALTASGTASAGAAPAGASGDLPANGPAVATPPAQHLVLEQVIRETPVLAGSGTFVPALHLVQDVDGDGHPDVLFPTPDGIAIYLGDGHGLAQEPASRVRLPLDDPKRSDGALVRHYPLPLVRDIDGDGKPDLLVTQPRRDWDQVQIWRGLGGGKFAPPVAPFPSMPPGAKEPNPSVVFIGDVDGDGKAEYVLRQSFEPGEKAGMREELAYAKEPPYVYSLHRLGADLGPDPQAYREFKAPGHAFGSSGKVRLPGGLQDLNGDGRLDLVSITLDFSLWQAARVLTTKRIGIGLDFRIWCQQPDGSFREVTGLDLSGKFTVDLNDLRIDKLSQFAGDFDGDGIVDFLQIGRGKTVAVHRGRKDCSYPSRPDFTIDLLAEPQDLALLEVGDWNGDGRADLLLVQSVEPVPGSNEEGSRPVRVDLYLSGGPR